MSILVSLIARAAHRYAVPLFIRTIKRFPLVFAGVAVVGQVLGAWLVCNCAQAGNWQMVAIGVFELVFYTGLLGLLAVKWLNGSWRDFCDYVLSLAE